MVDRTDLRTPRVERRDRIRNDLVVGMVKLLDEIPFVELSVDQIARSAGISRGSFYTYYGDKFEVMGEAVKSVHPDFLSALSIWWDADGAPRDRLEASYDAVTQVYHDNCRLMSVASEVIGYDPLVREIWTGFLALCGDGAAARIELEQSEGLIPSYINPAQMGFSLCWAAERIMYLDIALEGHEPSVAAEKIVGLWVASLYPDFAVER